jgi:hypothetical protein
MTQPNEPSESIPDLLAALADGELELGAFPEARRLLAEQPASAAAIAYHQQLRRSVASAMDSPSMRCPDALRAKLHQIADQAEASAPATHNTPAARPYTGPSVLARISQWAPAAVAAVLLIAATAVFFAGRGIGVGPTPPVLDLRTVQAFGSRHMHCAGNPDDLLHNHERFGDSIQQLPGHLDDYLAHSVSGLSLDLSSIDYDYQVAGVCSIPGDGAVHIIYRHQDDPARAMSLWIVDARDEVTAQMEPGRVYVEAGDELDHPVILWEDHGLLFYLVGDSLEGVQQAVYTLRHPAA